MPATRKHQRALQRVEAGTGKPLKPFRGWQPLSRALFRLPRLEDGVEVVYAVDVPYWQRATTENGEGRAHLYRNGIHHAKARMPAVFEVPGGMIEVVGSQFGLRRCRFVAADGSKHQLIPDERSAEGRRARLDQQNPALSQVIGAGSASVLLIGLCILAPQLLETLFAIPPVAERFGTFNSPVSLPWWGNIALALATATASTERATRLRYNILLDGAQE